MTLVHLCNSQIKGELTLTIARRSQPAPTACRGTSFLKMVSFTVITENTINEDVKMDS